MVAAGIVETAEVKRSLKYYVNNVLSKEIGKTPLQHDRAFCPTNDDIRNYVCKAKRTLELSKLDQENLRLKVEEWQKTSPQSSFFFRPFRTCPGTSDCHQPEEEGHTLADEEKSFEETLLYVHQEEWQKELLTRYGNTLTLMDATYKTTKYSIPLFFVYVKTNVSYTVVVEVIIQSETSEHILEALSMLKSWNQNWEPEYFMMDYSDAEMAAVRGLFPSTQVYLCEFHREQAWERWVKERRHGLNDIEASTLLDLLRDCASAPPNWNLPDQPPDYYFRQSLKQLHSSGVWQGNQHVQQWLNTNWPNCPKVRIHIYTGFYIFCGLCSVQLVPSIRRKPQEIVGYTRSLPGKTLTISSTVLHLYIPFPRFSFSRTWRPRIGHKPFLADKQFAS